MSLKVEIFPKIDIELKFDLEPAIDRLSLASKKKGKNKVRSLYKSDEYLVNLIQTLDAKKDTRLSFNIKRKNEDKFKVKGYGIDCLIPANFEYIFSPAHRTEDLLGFKGSHQHFEFYSAANSYIPFVLCTDRYGVNRFSVGFRDQVLETVIVGNMLRWDNQFYQLKLRRPLEGVVITRTQLEDALLFFTSEESWFEIVEKYCGKVDELTGYKPTSIPETYYEPQWNSWIPFYLDINEERIWEYAKICKELGIKMISIDAGWESARSDSWDEFGDWIPKPEKFPDMRGLISRIRKELGMLVELFIAPFYIGPASDAFKKLKNVIIEAKDGKSRSLCPRNPLTKKHVSEIAYRVTKELHPDFLLIDLTGDQLIPMSRCIADHEHKYESMGEGFNKCIEAMCTAIKRANPNTLIEACDTTNLNCKKFWPMTFDSIGGEVGLDSSLHQRQMVFTRSFSKGIVPKHTPLPWYMEAPDEEFGKHMIQQVMLGVPSLVGDLKKLSGSHAKILRVWLNFYRENKKELLLGEFRPIGFFGSTLPHVKIEGDKNVFIQVGNSGIPPITLEKRFEKAYILNSTESESLYLVLKGLRKGEYNAEIRNCFLELVGEKKMLCNEKCYIDINVPEGGLLSLESSF